jgi:Porin subfamily
MRSGAPTAAAIVRRFCHLNSARKFFTHQTASVDCGNVITSTLSPMCAARAHDNDAVVPARAQRKHRTKIAIRCFGGSRAHEKALLGGIAVLITVVGAHAAELLVKAKPVQYVKVCSLYGDGFYYLPGTQTL